MPDKPENHTLALLREIRTEIAGLREEVREGFTRVENHITASDNENAKVLDTIAHDLADLKTIFVDLQARVVRSEKRVKIIEKRWPDA